MSGFVYFFAAHQVGMVKIGMTKNLKTRFRDIQALSPCQLEVVATISASGCAIDLERKFHEKYQAHRKHGEWFIFADEIKADVQQISAGLFDTTDLPDYHAANYIGNFWVSSQTTEQRRQSQADKATRDARTRRALKSAATLRKNRRLKKTAA